MTLVFNLGEALKELNLTSHRLAVETKNRPASVLSLTKGQMKRLDLLMLDQILDELNRFAKEKMIDKEFTIEDIVKYIP